MKNDGGRTRCCSEGLTGLTAEQKSAEAARKKAAKALLKTAGQRLRRNMPDADEPRDPVESHGFSAMREYPAPAVEEPDEVKYYHSEECDCPRCQTQASCDRILKF